MKKLAALIMILTVTLGCRGLKAQFESPPGTTNAPPIAGTLTTLAPPIAVAVPQPWGTIAAALLSTIAAAATAYAASHSRQAAGNAKELAAVIKTFNGKQTGPSDSN